jgi:hypothetical protein
MTNTYTIKIPEYVWYDTNENRLATSINECGDNDSINNMILKKYIRKWENINMRRKSAHILDGIDIDVLSPPRTLSEFPSSPNSDDWLIVSPTQDVKSLFKLSAKDIEIILIDILNYIQQFIIVYINDPNNKNKPFTHEIMTDMLRHCKLFNSNFKILITYNYSDVYWINYIQITYANMLIC